jgi:regulator of sigma E protease
MDLAGLIPTFANLAWTIAFFVIALSIIVAVHEYGHYIVGRWTGIKADVFSIGFGPVIYSKFDRHGTKWQVAALPFGGFVKFRGDADAASGKDADAMSGLSEGELRSTMHGAPLWARTLTVAAGPAFNFVLSIIVFAFLLMQIGVPTKELTVDEIFEFPGVPQELMQGDVVLKVEGISLSDNQFSEAISQITPTKIATYVVRRDGQEIEVSGPWISPTRATSVDIGMPAEKAGIQVGDIVTSANGLPIFDFGALRRITGESEGNPISLEILRDGEFLNVELSAKVQDRPTNDGGFETRYLIGMGGGAPFSRATETPNILESLKLGVDRTFGVISSSVSGLSHMIAGKISTCNISGPIKIAQISGQAATAGWIQFFGFIAVLSAAVGFINLFPIPVLDGGHLVFYAFEAVFGRPPSDLALKYLMAGGLTVMLSLMLFALTNDIFCP